MDLTERYRGCLLGLAVGDAVGTALEFSPPGTFEPITDMVAGGPFRLEPGQWTDDTSMALCLAESLLACGGSDPVDQLRRYVHWWRESTPVEHHLIRACVVVPAFLVRLVVGGPQVGPAVEHAVPRVLAVRLRCSGVCGLGGQQRVRPGLRRPDRAVGRAAQVGKVHLLVRLPALRSGIERTDRFAEMRHDTLHVKMPRNDRTMRSSSPMVHAHSRTEHDETLTAQRRPPTSTGSRNTMSRRPRPPARDPGHARHRGVSGMYRGARRRAIP